MKETLLRAISGAVYVTLIVGGVWWGPESWVALSTVFFILGIFEWKKLSKLAFPKKKSMAQWILGIALYGGFAAWVIQGQPLPALPLAILAGILLLGHTVYLFVDKPEGSTLSATTYLAFPLGIGLLIPFATEGYQPMLLVVVFTGIWANDTFAYLLGKSIGKTPLAPMISPKKTWEGFAGGLVGVYIILFLLKSYLPSGNWWELAILAVIISFGSTVGDLLESKIKRKAGVKDSGAIMPGHGGILDRLDSYLFVAPLFYLYATLFY